ncbi:MAG: hypothetical protein V1875_07070, partial [Candidatus Altiarchaeota archaeon]
MLEELKKAFVSFDKKAVVFHPNIGENAASYQYWYALRKDFEHLPGYDNKIDKERNIRLIEKSLGSINGKCSRCDKSAKIAFFGKEAYRWSEGSWPHPLI